MDTKTLVKNLRVLFSNESKNGIKYTKVWLTPVYLLGFYKKYTLNVESEYEKKDEYDKIKELVSLVCDKAKNELKSISSLDVHQASEGYFCHGDDIVIYDEEDNIKYPQYLTST